MPSDICLGDVAGVDALLNGAGLDAEHEFYKAEIAMIVGFIFIDCSLPAPYESSDGRSSRQWT